MSQYAVFGAPSGSPSGDVAGPASATDNAIALFNGVTGKAIKESEALIKDGTASTSGAVTGNVVTIALGGTAGAFSIEALVVGFESSTPAGVAYKLIAGAITDGASATVIGTADVTSNEDAALTAASVDLVASGNNVIVQVTGVAALDINWKASAKYIEVT